MDGAVRGVTRRLDFMSQLALQPTYVGGPLPGIRLHICFDEKGKSSTDVEMASFYYSLALRPQGRGNELAGAQQAAQLLECEGGKLVVRLDDGGHYSAIQNDVEEEMSEGHRVLVLAHAKKAVTRGNTDSSENETLSLQSLRTHVHQVNLQPVEGLAGADCREGWLVAWTSVNGLRLCFFADSELERILF